MKENNELIETDFDLIDMDSVIKDLGVY